MTSHRPGGWLTTFFAAAIGTASIMIAVWAIWLVADPHEQIHFEVAIPVLLLAFIGAMTAVVAWRRGR